MTVWTYVEPSLSGELIVVRMTEEQILNAYWNYWCMRMFRAHKSPMITEKNCIDDFVVVNWASRES